jgi:hypothetical protein
MRIDQGDNLATITAIGLLAYTSADIAHHVFGHAAACLLIGGHANLVTSQFVNCTVTGSFVDLAGPLASLVLGLMSLFAVRLLRRPSSALRLFLILVAAFNLFWFNLQLLYSAASRKDDWAWALHEFHVPAAGRYCLIVAGALGYTLSIHFIAHHLKTYAIPRLRISRICLISWLAAGVLACVTAMFDHDQSHALRGALPQAMGLSLGLLLIPKRASRLSEDSLSAVIIRFSPIWVVAALLVSAASIALLGPGFSS